MTTSAILAEVAIERERQAAKWGGASHDDQHDSLDWWTYRQKFDNRTIADLTPNQRKRDALIKIAALAVAQIESIDRWEAA